MPLRVIFRRAVEDADVAVNPCTHLRLPAVRGRRDRIASPEEAERLLAALPERDRPIWATALYARGELMALRWDDVDLANGVILRPANTSLRSWLASWTTRMSRRMPTIGTDRRPARLFGSTSKRAFSSYAYGKLMPGSEAEAAASVVKGTEFRELRTRFAGQQYSILYLQDGDAFVLFVGFHKTSDRDLGRAVRAAEKHLADYRSEQSERARRSCPPDD